VSEKIGGLMPNEQNWGKSIASLYSSDQQYMNELLRAQLDCAKAQYDRERAMNWNKSCVIALTAIVNAQQFARESLDP
jgi:hypothetical protein